MKWSVPCTSMGCVLVIGDTYGEEPIFDSPGLAETSDHRATYAGQRWSGLAEMHVSNTVPCQLGFAANRRKNVVQYSQFLPCQIGRCRRQAPAPCRRDVHRRGAACGRGCVAIDNLVRAIDNRNRHRMVDDAAAIAELQRLRLAGT